MLGHARQEGVAYDSQWRMNALGKHFTPEECEYALHWVRQSAHPLNNHVCEAPTLIASLCIQCLKDIVEPEATWTSLKSQLVHYTRTPILVAGSASALAMKLALMRLTGASPEEVRAGAFAVKDVDVWAAHSISKHYEANVAWSKYQNQNYPLGYDVHTIDLVPKPRHDIQLMTVTVLRDECGPSFLPLDALLFSEVVLHNFDLPPCMVSLCPWPDASPRAFCTPSSIWCALYGKMQVPACIVRDVVAHDLDFEEGSGIIEGMRLPTMTIGHSSGHHRRLLLAKIFSKHDIPHELSDVVMRHAGQVVHRVSLGRYMSILCAMEIESGGCRCNIILRWWLGHVMRHFRVADMCNASEEERAQLVQNVVAWVGHEAFVAKLQRDFGGMTPTPKPELAPFFSTVANTLDLLDTLKVSLDLARLRETVKVCAEWRANPLFHGMQIEDIIRETIRDPRLNLLGSPWGYACEKRALEPTEDSRHTQSIGDLINHPISMRLVKRVSKYATRYQVEQSTALTLSLQCSGPHKIDPRQIIRPIQ